MSSEKLKGNGSRGHYDKSKTRIKNATQYLNEQKMAKQNTGNNGTGGEEIPPKFTNDFVKNIVKKNDEREKLKDSDPSYTGDEEEEEIEYIKLDGDPKEDEGKKGDDDSDPIEPTIEDDGMLDGPTLLYYLEMGGMMIVPWICERQGKEKPDPKKLAYDNDRRAAMMKPASKVAAKMKRIPDEWILLGMLFAMYAPIVRDQPKKAEFQKTEIVE